MEKIKSFKELLNEICWSYNYPLHDIYRHENGDYSIDKLYIGPLEASYKTDIYELSPKVFEDLNRFYDFLVSTERK